MNSHKYYAVKYGRMKGIYFNQDDAYNQIVNFPNGEYEVFTDIRKAENYILNNYLSNYHLLNNQLLNNLLRFIVNLLIIIL